MSLKAFLVILSLFPISKGFCQSASTPIVLTMDDAVKMACMSPILQNTHLQVEMRKAQNQAINLPPTEITYGYGQFHSSLYDKSLEVKQNFGSPMTYIYQRKINTQQTQLAEVQQKITLKQLIETVKTAYFNQVFEYCKLKELKYQTDKLSFLDEELRVLNEKGDSALLNRTILETRYAEVQNDAFQAEQEWLKSRNDLQKAIFSETPVTPMDTILELYAIVATAKGMDKFRPTSHIAWYQKQEEIAKTEIKLNQANQFPEFSASYLNQELYHNKGFQGFSVGISVPLSFVQNKSNIEKARLNQQITQNETSYQSFALTKTIENLKIQLDQSFVAISYYRENALRQADLIEKTADTNRLLNKMPAEDYLEAIRAVSKIRVDYLEKIKEYNLTAIQLEYYIN